MSRDIGFVMDPLAGITPKKDSTLAMMLAAQRRGWRIHEIHPADLAMRDSTVSARMRTVTVHDDETHWHDVMDVVEAPMSSLDAVMMRKDPPFDMDYIYATYLLEQVEAVGVPVFNRPRALRDANEKLFTAWFPQCCPPTLVTARHESLRAFIAEQGETIVKPLDGMGGTGVFRMNPQDPNINSVLETLGYSNLERIWLERVEREVREGRRKVTKRAFELHIVRQTDSGVTYEDTIDHLSESEREVTGLVFALAGYLAHEVYETVPFMLLDSLEAIDSDRIAALVEYVEGFSEHLVVALLPEDAAALPDTYARISDI